MTSEPTGRPAEGYEDEGLGPKDHSDGQVEGESELTRDGLGPSPHTDRDGSETDPRQDESNED